MIDQLDKKNKHRITQQYYHKKHLIETLGTLHPASEYTLFFKYP